MRRKIKDKKGATLIFAMVIFLIATIVSLTIVSIAVTNVKKVRRQRDEQQATLAISSAARYAQHLFDGCSYYYDKDAGDMVLAFGESELGKLGKSDQSFIDEFQTLAEKKFKNSGNAWIKDSEGKFPYITWSISVKNGNVEINELGVKLETTFDERNNIVTRIYQDEYSMTLVCTVNKFFDVDNPDESNPYEYTWNYAYVDRYLQR